jgi:glycolate oxidase iron-sulfur subunit
VAYFLSCGFDLLLPQVGLATLQVLVSGGYAVEVRRNYCCGLPPFSHGDLATARRLARGNLRLLGTLDVEAVLTDCASCSSFLKSYPRLLGQDHVFGPRASELAGKVQDLSEFLARQAPWHGLGKLPLRVTYHDPCHASRYQGLREEPRRLLRSIPGLELVEMEEADWCCGGAGTFSITHPQLSRRILDRKMENVARTEAQTLATLCPSCIIQLSHGARRRELPVRVLHVSQLLAEAQGQAKG